MNLIAVSGGVDSMTLLNTFKQEKVAVVHINHHTRGEENFMEEKLVQDFCLKNQIKFFKINYKYNGKKNFHDEARNFRYDTYRKLCEENNYDSVFLAHHFDDQIENILMNPKKIGPKIMKKEERINGVLVIRPFLNKTKEEIYTLAQINKVPYLEDSSNTTTKYFRNKIRFALKDYTYEEKKQIYFQEVQRIQQLNDTINVLSMKKDIKTTDLTNQMEVYAFLKIKGINSNISINKINLILRFLKTLKNGEITIDKNNKLVVVYGKVDLLDRYLKEDKITTNQALIQGINDFNGIIFKNNMYKGNIRTYRQGDKISLKKGTKKVNRIFIDEKVPRELRNKWPLIENEHNEIIKVIKMVDVIKIGD